MGYADFLAASLGMNVGRAIMARDNHYLGQGIDRPMCGGVWLDWQESKSGDSK